MKAAIILLLSFSFLSVSAFGQATSAREIVKKTVPKDQRTPPAPANPPANTPAQPAQRKATAPAAKPKTDAQKQEIERKTVEFQTKRAKEGSASAQYDLGVRYLTGAGVEKNEKEARKWLEASAKQGNTSATKKLAELDKAKPQNSDLK